MSEITKEGYQSIREFAVSSYSTPNEWDYLALYDSDKNEITRVSITSDSRFSWSDLDEDNVSSITGTIKGSDSDIPTDGTTVEYLALHDSASGGRQITPLQSVAPRTFTSETDEWSFVPNVEIPRVL
jgi:hypothetical protein